MPVFTFTPANTGEMRLAAIEATHRFSWDQGRPFPGTEDEPTAEAFLSTLQADGALLKAAQDAVRLTAGSARKAGASWSQIGDALGISRQAAQQRFRR